MSTSSKLGSNRRRFFREAVGRMVQPLAEYLEQRWDLPVTRTCLRPPGAIEEAQFLDTCYRCGACAAVCPAGAIVQLGGGAGDLAGTPMIDPDLAACTLCAGLKCTHTCPSGALQPLDDPAGVSVGLAEVYVPVCARSAGEACTACVDRCPVGESALRLSGGGPPEVLVPGCVGCGTCQHYCPTTPKAIVVKP